jgi:coenzyme F420-0:L-glutamate ligase/coenzyme F420-1:gamma-L-glutamate ligase
MTLTLTPLAGIPLVRKGDDIVNFILNGLADSSITLTDGDVLVITQKIVSKVEGRMVNLNDVKPSGKAIALGLRTEKDPRLVELILNESDQVLRSRPGLIIVEHKLGFICANAGIDHSNVKGEFSDQENWVLLLPENPDASADSIRKGLEEISGTRLGVLIIDSHGRAWRVGTQGVAIGLSGIQGVVDMRGKQDLFDYTLQVTVIGAADELAAASSLIMGQADEGYPVVHARGFPYALRDGSLNEIIRPKELDLFR